MVGSPPPPDRMLRFDDGSYFQFPAMRWSVSHFRQLMPTVNVSRGLAPAAPLAQALREDIDELRFTPLRSEEHTSELQSQSNLVCRLLLEKKKKPNTATQPH